LVDLAMQAGGEDNITVQFLRYGDAEKVVAEQTPGGSRGSGDARVWKIVGSIAAAVLGSTATFAYFTLREPLRRVDEHSRTKASAEARIGGSSVSDEVEVLQREVRDLTARVQKLEAAGQQPASQSDGGRKAGGGSQSNAVGAKKGRNKSPAPKGGTGDPN